MLIILDKMSNLQGATNSGVLYNKVTASVGDELFAELRHHVVVEVQK